MKKYLQGCLLALGVAGAISSAALAAYPEGYWERSWSGTSWVSIGYYHGTSDYQHEGTYVTPELISYSTACHLHDNEYTFANGWHKIY